MTRLRWLVPCLVLCSALFPAAAGRLADLPWDDKIPQELRAGARRALAAEAAALGKEVNAAGKKFVRTYPSELIDPLPGGRARAHMVVQRCLADRMVSERWTYTVAKGARDYEIVAREKLGEDDSYRLLRVDPVTAARPVKPFTLEHDLLTLRVEQGTAILAYRGDEPDTLMIAGRARLQLKPLDDYEEIFFRRRLDRAAIDTEVSAIQLDFHEDDASFLELAGLAGPGGSPATAAPGKGLEELRDEVMRLLEGREFTPYAYQAPPRPERRGHFRLRMKTADHGWLDYRFDPSAAKEIAVWQEIPQLAGSNPLDRWEERGISEYWGPATRKLPAAEREHRRDLRLTDALRYDAMFDVEGAQFTAHVTTDLSLLADTDELFFALAGNPTVKSVRLDAQELPFAPELNLWSKQYGHEETANYFRVRLPSVRKAGEALRLHVAYQSPKIVSKISEGFWYIERGGFLPFSGALAEPAYMHFVIRSNDAYDHVSIGSRLAEERVSGHRYTEWGDERGFNFPTLIIGKYFPPIEKDLGGVRFTGYMTRSFMGKDQALPAGINPADAQSWLNELPEARPSDMEPQLAQAIASVQQFERLLNVPYGFRDLKLVGTPAQFLSAQSPSSIVYIGEAIFWPDAALARLFRGLDPTWTHNVTAHEVGHQWFGGHVANISADHYWFVETTAELAAALYAEAQGDKAALRGMRDHWRTTAMEEDWQKALIDDISRNEPYRGTMLRYTKGPLVFWMLREYYGPQKLLMFLRGLLQFHDGDLIGTAEVQAVAEKAFGQKMDWFFDQYVRRPGIPEVRYRFEAPRPAEDGKGWIIQGQLSQRVLLKGDPLPGRFFRNLLVPLTVETEAGPQRVDQYLDEPEKTVRIRLESRPKGAVKVEENLVWMTAVAAR